MKESCFGCRALHVDTCTLGYTVAVIFRTRKKEVIPTTECPKPLTYKDIYAIKNMNELQLELFERELFERD